MAAHGSLINPSLLYPPTSQQLDTSIPLKGLQLGQNQQKLDLLKQQLEENKQQRVRNDTLKEMEWASKLIAAGTVPGEEGYKDLIGTINQSAEDLGWDLRVDPDAAWENKDAASSSLKKILDRGNKNPKDVRGNIIALKSWALEYSGDVPASKMKGVQDEITAIEEDIRREESPTLAEQKADVFAAGTPEQKEGAVFSEGQGKPPALISIFEATSSDVSEAERGTPQYEQSFNKWRAKTYGTNQVLGMTPEGVAITINNRSGKLNAVDPQGELLPKNKKILSENALNDIGTFDSILAGMTNIRQLAKSNKDFLGPVEGNWNKLKSKFVNNGDFVTLDREVESLITIAYALSGKQISEKEITLLKAAILPSVTLPEQNFMAALDHAERWLKRNRDNRVKNYKSSWYYVSDELSGKQPVQQPSTSVKVVSPDGTSGSIPASQLQDALSQGYKRQ